MRVHTKQHNRRIAKMIEKGGAPICLECGLEIRGKPALIDHTLLCSRNAYFCGVGCLFKNRKKEGRKWRR